MAENETRNQQTPAPADLAQKVADLETALAGGSEELHKANLRMAELEKAAVEANSRADHLAGNLKTVFNGYKSLMVQSNPDVPAELLTGETIEALDGSLAKARELINRVKTRLETQKAAAEAAAAAAARVPAGAPLRGTADTTGLSSREKINLGVERTRK
jgi:hypothetical protein